MTDQSTTHLSECIVHCEKTSGGRQGYLRKICWWEGMMVVGGVGVEADRISLGRGLLSSSVNGSPSIQDKKSPGYNIEAFIRNDQKLSCLPHKRELRSISDNHCLPVTAKRHALWEPRNSTVYPQRPVFWNIFVIKESKRSVTQLPHTNLSPQPGINQLKYHKPTSSCHILSV